MNRPTLLLAFLIYLSSETFSSGENPPLLLISIDGFRYDYFEKAPTPNLDQLRYNGLQAEGLIPVFPTNTFPNHYAIVTGLYPEHSGIVANRFYDPIYDAIFDMDIPKEVTRGRWWHGEPIWVTARRQGLIAGTLFWPGSEAVISGYRPNYWIPYDHDMPHSERITQIFNWLDLPDEKRPRFLTLYFHDVDSAGHDFGPDSSQLIQSIEAVDRSIGHLLEGMKRRSLLNRIHIIVVSDHGMVETDQRQLIIIDDLIDPDELAEIEVGATTAIWVAESKVSETSNQLRKVHQGMRVFTRNELPDRLRYRNHIRIPPLLCLADEGWTITTRRELSESGGRIEKGGHGYDNTVKNMQGVFIAHGPAIPPASNLPAFPNVEIYEFMCHLLNIDPAPNDGTGWLTKQLLNGPDDR